MITSGEKFDIGECPLARKKKTGEDDGKWVTDIVIIGYFYIEFLT